MIIRAPWFYGPFQPPGRRSGSGRCARAGSRSSATAPSSARWCSPTTWSRGSSAPRPRPRAAGRGVLDRRRASRTSSATSWRRCARRWRPRGSRSRAASPGCRAIAGVVAEKVDGFLQGRGQYVQALHVLGELKDTIACDISPRARRARVRPARRACSTACGPASGGASSTVRSCEHARRSSPAGAATSARSSPSAAQAPGDDVRIFDLNPPGDPAVEHVDRRRPRPRRRARRVRRASTSCCTTSRRCRSPRTATSSGRSTSSAPRTCCSRRAMPASARSSTRRRARSSGFPRRIPVTEDTPPGPLEAYGRAKLEAELAVPRRGRRGPRRLDRPARARSSATAGSASWRSCSSSSPTARRCSCSASGDNRYQFVHADDLADACLRAALRPGRAGLQHRLPRVRHDARDAAGARRPRGHRFARGVAARRAGPASRCVRSASRRWSPFAPYHWLLYGESLWFDVTKARARARLGADALERVDGDRVVRVVPRAPRRRSAATGKSHHQSPAKLGLLKLVKRLPL